MKQIYQFVTLLCFVPIGLLAQYSQSFDSATMPADWTVINGGDPGTWETWTSYDSSFNAPHSGTHFLGLEYGSTAHDDYVVSPAIVVTAGVSDKLTFWARNRGAGLAETVDVKISTTTPTVAGLTNTLAAAVKPPTSWNQYTYDLTPYVGQTIYIAFHSTTDDIWFIGIDDFQISANSLSVSDVKADSSRASIYPNPVKDILSIKNKTKISEINIYDFNGKLVKKEMMSSENGTVNVSELAAGNYIVKVKDRETEKGYKIIKK
ncbi:Por secretion system C-terminal sorting domain-containing protein [Chryseobacterium rhizoplanae]|uniref:Por secretion system C-terminal sorting domain-containing protein n=1 Tax=Chryseobacterium rhizoplanae TaxID=1609531 RepID=A0A521C9D6_9FLAO|nr:choice-of-anchor J domain-containing protein [Chryseobacterium rhizoplanae]SMO55985.1 Por secretion system C-terminal sorting domain-containing protein [Chryseobacterium rhizoplanae]